MGAWVCGAGGVGEEDGAVAGGADPISALGGAEGAGAGDGAAACELDAGGGEGCSANCRAA